VGTAVALILLEPKPKKPVATWHGVEVGVAPAAPGADLAGASLYGNF
jgi:hypothetical protein